MFYEASKFLLQKAFFKHALGQEQSAVARLLFTQSAEQ